MEVARCIHLPAMRGGRRFAPGGAEQSSPPIHLPATHGGRPLNSPPRHSWRSSAVFTSPPCGEVGAVRRVGRSKAVPQSTCPPLMEVARSIHLPAIHGGRPLYSPPRHAGRSALRAGWSGAKQSLNPPARHSWRSPAVFTSPPRGEVSAVRRVGRSSSPATIVWRRPQGERVEKEPLSPARPAGASRRKPRCLLARRARRHCKRWPRP